MFGNCSGIAGGNISPSRFVTKTQSSGEAVISQAGANADVFGVSQPSTRWQAWAAVDDGYAAVATEMVTAYGVGQTCKLAIAGTVAAGDLLKSDSAGRGVATTTDKDRVGARANHAGVSGDVIEVTVGRFDISV